MGFSHAYGAPTKSEDVISLLRQAVTLGYTFFDTAEVYGTQENPHINEELVGKSIGSLRQRGHNLFKNLVCDSIQTAAYILTH